MKPEDKARVTIDAKLAAAGQAAQDAADLELAAVGAVARSVQMGTQEADYRSASTARQSAGSRRRRSGRR